MAIKKKKPAGVSMGDTPVMFKQSDAQRIANVVHSFESSRRGRNPSTLPRAPGGGGSGGVIRARFTGGWPKGATKQIAFAADTLSTANAVNIFRSIPFSSLSLFRECFVSPAGGDSGTYLLVNAEP